MNKKRIPTVYDQDIPNDYSLSKQGITQSLLSNWLQCRREFVLALNRWRGSEGRAAVFGSLIHDVLANIYTSKKKKFDLSKMIAEHFEGLGFKMGNDTQMDFLKAEVVLKYYLEYYKDDFKKKKFTDVEKESEVEFEGFVLRCKKDGRFIQGKSIWLLETKTKGRIEEDKMARLLNLSLQNLFYVLCDELEHKKPVKGVLQNIIRNPGLRQGSKETDREYMRRIAKDIEARPDHYFMRYEIPYTKADKEMFKKNLLAILCSLGDSITHKNLWFNPCGCDGKFACKYLDACSSGSMALYKQGDKIFPELNSY